MLQIASHLAMPNTCMSTFALELNLDAKEHFPKLCKNKLTEGKVHSMKKLFTTKLDACFRC